MTTYPQGRAPAGERIDSRLADPDPVRLEAFDEVDWTSHNIPLAEGRSTMGSDLPLIGDDARTRMIRRVLGRFDGHRAGAREAGRSPRLLDLGALEAGLSFEMVRDGYDVLCVEGREENVTKCRLVQSYFDLDELEVLQSDVRDLDPERNGVFDVILCCGLLYHLEEPFAFLRLLERLLQETGVLILDTHVAPSQDADVEASLYAGQLSALDTVSVDETGVRAEGRWIGEHEPEADATHPWSSIGNPTSFWPTRDGLLLGLEAAGFGMAFEAFGMFPLEQEFDLRARHCRTMLVAAAG